MFARAIFRKVDRAGLFVISDCITFNERKGTHNPTPPLDVFAASKISSLEAGIRYDFHLEGTIRYSVSGEFSNLRSGNITY